jgi:hypothetical protein
MVVQFVEVRGCEVQRGERGEAGAGDYFGVGFWSCQDASC